VRVRRDNEDYYLTYKSKGLMVREEYNLPLTAEAYNSLIKKADGYIITKKRYEIPEKDNLTIELDVFEGSFCGLLLAEVEFGSEEDALSYTPPAWFGKDVTNEKTYHNSNMAQHGLQK
jgi:adenylate cyclase